MTQHFQARVFEIEDFPAARLRRLLVEPEQATSLPDYHAGQYATLNFPGFSPRPFSIANAPGKQMLEFHIRRSGSGVSEYAATKLQVGDTIELAAPFGECIYVKDCTRPVVAIAGGSGLACMKAIIEEALADDGREAPVTLYYGARHYDDLYLDEFFRVLAEQDQRFKYMPALTDSAPEGYRQGLVTACLWDDLADLSGYRVYAAGPVEMLRHIHERAPQHGLSAERLHSDLNDLQKPKAESSVLR